MKSKIAQLFFLFVVTLSVAGFASAQRGTTYEAEIPFDFTVGKHDFKAGKYTITVGFIPSSTNHFLIRSVEGKEVAIVIGTPKSNNEALTNYTLTFNLSDDTYALTEINTQRARLELEIPKQERKNRVEVTMKR